MRSPSCAGVEGQPGTKPKHVDCHRATALPAHERVSLCSVKCFAEAVLSRFMMFSMGQFELDGKLVRILFGAIRECEAQMNAVPLVTLPRACSCAHERVRGVLLSRHDTV